MILWHSGTLARGACRRYVDALVSGYVPTNPNVQDIRAPRWPPEVQQ